MSLRPEDSQGTQEIISKQDIVLAADSEQNGAGDIVFRTGGVERARIDFSGVGTGLLGGSQPYDYVVKTDGATMTAHTPTGAVIATGADLGAILTTLIATLASTAGNPVGKISLGPGVFNYTTQAQVPPVPAVAGVARAADPRGLLIEGSGLATKIVNQSAGLGFVFPKRGADYDTFGRVEVRDLLYDANQIAGFYCFMGVYDGTSASRQRVNFEPWTCRRVTMINAPTSDPAGTTHVGVYWVSSYHPGAGETQTYLRSGLCEDVVADDNGNFGAIFTGDGGAATCNVAVGNFRAIRCRQTCYRVLADGTQASNSATITVKTDPAVKNPPTNPTDLLPASGIVKVTSVLGNFRSITYTGKTATTLTGCTVNAGTDNIQDGSGIGYPTTSNFAYASKGLGSRYLLRDCSGGCSGDNSIEIDGCDFALVSNYYARDVANVAYYQKTFQASPNAKAQRIIYDDCHYDNLDFSCQGLGWQFAGTGFTTRSIVMNQPSIYVAGDYVFSTIGRFVWCNLPTLAELTINDPRGYWDTGGVASIQANVDPMFFRLNPTGTCKIEIKSPNLEFAGAAPTLNAHQYRPIGIGVLGSDIELRVNGTGRWVNAPGASANTRKGFIVLGYTAAATVRGSLEGLIVESITNDAAPQIVRFESGWVGDASHKFTIHNIDVSKAPAATILASYNAAATQAPFVAVRGNQYGTLVPPAPAAMTGLVTAVGLALATGWDALIAFTAGSGAGITAIDFSTDSGTTYTNLLTQAAAAMPADAGFRRLLGPLPSDALIKVTFTTTQPTITLVPVNP